MSRSNNDKPFYVDFDKGITSIRCASNHDVLVRYDSMWYPETLDIAKKVCDRMNKEVEVSRPLRNCDVGTAEEQYERWRSNCGNGIPNCVSGCKVYKRATELGLLDEKKRVKCDCKFVWAQMPYEEAKEGD